jgi:hypothetical protein
LGTTVTNQNLIWEEITKRLNFGNAWPRDTLLSRKVGTKFRRQVAVAQSV